jgi:hypothetical protein
MKKLLGSIFGVVALTAGLAACGSQSSLDTDSSSTESALKGKPASSKAAQLNLSHIACDEEGGVIAHFVLLHSGSDQPGAISGTWNGGTFGPVESDKLSGNVWHYNVSLPSGEIDIYSATTTTSAGASVSLHNPSEYAGNYECGGAVEECPVEVEDAEIFCTDQPLGNPGSECAAFGLLPQGKDDNLSGLTHSSTQDAYLALVKSGTRGCGPGSSAYRVYTNVSVGEELHTPVDQEISHVTYCACPQ